MMIRANFRRTTEQLVSSEVAAYLEVDSMNMDFIFQKGTKHANGQSIHIYEFPHAFSTFSS